MVEEFKAIFTAMTAGQHRYTATCKNCGQFSVTYYPKLQKTTRHECRYCHHVIVHKLADLTPQENEAKWAKFKDFIDKGEKNDTINC